ncbi:MAG: GNAT family N-acetyltransferase [Phycisphaerales bacterium]|nr:MAG: GNAT family N-acetyltransferase [Phycisphaerales bacterium]
MANARIDVVGPYEIEVIVDLYNRVFTPKHDASHFERRFKGRHNVCMMVASVEDAAVGFNLGFELTPSTYFSWLCGVLPDYRRAGIASQLLEGQRAWAADHGYVSIRFECANQHRPMLHAAITQGYDLVGLRWDTESGDNVVIFERMLT